MLALKRQLGGEEQRIIVSGDADWFSTEGLALRKDDVRLNNFGLFMEMLHYMTYQQFPVDNSRPSPTDDTHYLDIADIGWIKIYRPDSFTRLGRGDRIPAETEKAIM